MASPADATPVVLRDLADWSDRFLHAARAGDARAAEAAVAGLVDWLGHDLVDHRVGMDAAAWIALSDLAEELFETLRAAGTALAAAGGAWQGYGATAGRVEGILGRAGAIGGARGTRCP